MFDKIRKRWHRSASTDPAAPTGVAEKQRPHNLFEAAAVYVAACAEDDQEGVDEAAGWVSPEALSFGVNELACRAVIALARERDESPRDVARTLLGLPAA
ncbi:hypothetical protein [Streptomyces flavofungini]|uniref:hypothetical protein n=1 Tax=Streptomyces flavofungini TaxID=68200 RepID=UPI0025B1A231|nr:hypothetical protein [Streptomyces flavofungini]WJV44502.1 hypothetical protein QUY26_02515 [Streptomyces flavofungini]